MRIKIIKFCSVLLCFLSVSTTIYAVTDVSLSGEWELHPAQLAPANIYLPESSVHQSATWQKLNIPNNWYLAGYDLSGAVWHRRYFDISPEQQKNTARLNFKAVDYAADVWLNGHYLGFHEGYFAPFGFDVTGLLHAKDNLLVVRVDSPNEMPDKVWSLHKRLIKGVLNHHDTRPAGAWSIKGQDANSGGIWQDVNLHFSKDLSITHLKTTTQLAVTELSTQLNEANMSTKITINTVQPLAEMQLSLSVNPQNIKAKSQIFDYVIAPNQWLKTGDHQYQYVAKLTPKNIKTWWPKGYGEPALYKMSVSLSKNGRLLDEFSQKLAFRTINYDKANTAFLFNGKRIFVKGTNYIASPWLASMNRQTYASDIDLMQAAHINAVRVHAHIAGKDLYDIADEKGMLIWQDFPLQWGYEDSEAFSVEAQRQAYDMLELLDDHPSVFAWSGHNEPPWNADWMKYKYADYEPQQNRQLTAKVGAVLATDSTRYAHEYSATNEHLWMGWYSGNWRDHAKRTTVSIVSEFGAQALPDVATLQTIIPNNDLWPKTLDPKDPAWQSWDYHNFQVQETFKNAGIERGESLEDFVQNSQSYQARLTQLAAESYRRQRYQPVAAMFQFMFNETWPSINWGIVDYKRQPKLGYQALKQAYQPILPSIEWDNDRIKANEAARFVLWAINDTWQDIPKAILQYRLRDAQNKIVSQGKRSIEIKADTGIPVWELKFKSLAVGNYQLETELLSTTKQTLGNNQFGFTVLESSKP
jgi:beta-mannosidase